MRTALIATFADRRTFAPADVKSGNGAVATAAKTAEPVAPAVATAPPPSMAVTFRQPSYVGKAGAARRNIADAVLVGCFPDGMGGIMPLQLAGFTLAKASDDPSVIVYHPKSGGSFAPKKAVEPLQIAAPADIETPDGMVLARGARGSVERFDAAMIDAWARANNGGATSWGTAITLDPKLLAR